MIDEIANDAAALLTDALSDPEEMPTDELKEMIRIAEILLKLAAHDAEDEHEAGRS